MIEIKIDLASFLLIAKPVLLYLSVGAMVHLFAINSKFYREIQIKIAIQQQIKLGVPRLLAETLAERYIETDFVRLLFLWPLWCIAVFAAFLEKLKTKTHD
jgi:hypothetical protein